MNKLAAVWLAINGAWFSAAACKSEPIEAERVPAASFGAAFAKALCDNAADCCSRSKFAFDHTNCEGRVKASLQGQLDEVLGDLVDYDAEAAGKCLTEVDEHTSCGRSVLDFPVCEGLLVGRLEDGQPCERNVTCKSGWCAFLGDTADSACAPLQNSGPVAAGKAGDTCFDSCQSPGHCPPIGSSETLTVCYRSDGLFCSYAEETQAQSCQPLREVGESCDFDTDCVGGLFCQGLCEAPHPNGASCDNESECQSGACLDGECVDSFLTEDACTSGGADI